MKERKKWCGAVFGGLVFFGVYGYHIFSAMQARAQGSASDPITAPIGATATILDEDGDGLSDGGEQAFSTNPHNPDTDSDGYSDYEEVFTYFSNPLDSCSPDPKDCAPTAPVVVVLPLPRQGFGAVGTVSLFKLEMKQGFVEASWAPPPSGAYEGFLLLKDDAHFISDPLSAFVVYRGRAISYRDSKLATARGKIWYYSLFAYNGDKISAPLFAAISLKDAPQEAFVPMIKDGSKPQGQVIPLASAPLLKMAPFDTRGEVYHPYREFVIRILGFILGGVFIGAGGLFFMRLLRQNYPKKKK